MEARPEAVPIVDLHCDLLSYLHEVKDGDPRSRRDIGCSIPALKEGNVKLQVLAVYTATGDGSVAAAAGQIGRCRRLLREEAETFALVGGPAVLAMNSDRIGVMLGIENASGLIAEDESLSEAFVRLEMLSEQVGRPLYISLTHHDGNRFGGGNASTAGLLDDGRVFLEYLSGKGIAVDLSHASDATASGILSHIDGKGLDIPLVASHSNFRAVWNHKRNLPDEIALELIRRDGLIGLNFLRAFLHPENPAALLENVAYGLRLGAGKALCFGADFFYTEGHQNRELRPFFFSEHEDAGKYQTILHELEGVASAEEREALAFGNAASFLARVLKAD